MALEQKGKLIYIGNKNYYGNDGKYNCEFVIETQEQYPKIIAFEAHNEKCDRIQEVSLGQEITVHFNLSSREYQGRYYTKASMWKFEIANQSGQYANPAVQQPKQTTQQSRTNDLPSYSEDDDSLPF